MSIVALIFIRSGLNLAIFGVIFAVLSYLRTSRFKRLTGVNPWHIDPLIWAVGSFFIALLGTLLSIIACATTNFPGKGTGRRYYGGPAQAPGYGPPPGFGPPAGYGPGGYGSPLRRSSRSRLRPTSGPGPAAPFHRPGRIPRPIHRSPPRRRHHPHPPRAGRRHGIPTRPDGTSTATGTARYWTEHVSDHGAARDGPRLSPASRRGPGRGVPVRAVSYERPHPARLGEVARGVAPAL